MEKIDIEKLGLPKNEKGFYMLDRFSSEYSIRQLAEKVNEIIAFINFVGEKDGNDSYLAEFNQSNLPPLSK